MSPTVVVAYMASNSNTLDFGYCNGQNPKYSWNSKKWRMLCLIDENFIIANREYPCVYPEAGERAIEALKSMAEQSIGLDYYTEKPIILDYGSCGYSITELDNVSKIRYKAETFYMYNDLSQNLAYVPRINATFDGSYVIEYTKETMCLNCGKHPIKAEDSLVCEKCNAFMRCYECGDICTKDEMSYVNDRYYCEDCMSQFNYTCDKCDEFTFSENGNPNNVIHIQLYNSNNELRSIRANICDDCLKDLKQRGAIIKKGLIGYEKQQLCLNTKKISLDEIKTIIDPSWFQRLSLFPRDNN